MGEYSSTVISDTQMALYQSFKKLLWKLVKKLAKLFRSAPRKREQKQGLLDMVLVS